VSAVLAVPGEDPAEHESEAAQVAGLVAFGLVLSGLWVYGLARVLEARA